MIQAKQTRLLAWLGKLFVLEQTQSRSLEQRSTKTMKNKYDCMKSRHKGRRPFIREEYQTVYTSGLRFISSSAACGRDHYECHG